MSIQNLLVDNNLTINCKDLEVSENIIIDGVSVPTFLTNTISVPLFYDGVQIDSKNIVFQRLAASGEEGICFAQIPAFHYQVTTASRFYFQLSNTGLLIAPGKIHYQNGIVVTNNSVENVGVAYTDPVNQRIYIARTGPTDFTIPGVGNENGLTLPIIFTYIQAFA